MKKTTKPENNKSESKSEEIVVHPKRLATEKHPTIEAVINGLFRFETEEQALERLEAIKDYFIISARLPKEEKEANVLKLWIRGYDVDEEEEKKGFLGNYAAIKVKKVKDKFTLKAEKQRIAIKYHPHRKRPKTKHPDWGHPCLRIVKKGKIFNHIDDAQKLLNQLHEEYPEISIPGVGKLYIILYSKQTQPPTKKYILEIQAAKEGGFIIEHKENNYQKKDEKLGAGAAKKTAVETPKREGEAKGYFTSMVQARASKKRKPDIKIPKKPD